MQRLEWKTFVSDKLIATVTDAAGVDRSAEPGPIAERLARIIENEGGPPVSLRALSATQRYAVATGLVEDALRRAFSPSASASSLPGVELCCHTRDKDRLTPSAKERLGINFASAAEIEALPVAGKALARRIVEARRTAGPFTSKNDLVQRVRGIGSQGADALGLLVHFEPVPPETLPSGGLGKLIQFLVRRFNAAPNEALLTILECAAVNGGREVATRWHGDRLFQQPLPDLPHTSETLLILRGSTYYGWLCRALGEAKKSIDVIQFHIALPTEKHPTKALLDALVEAHERGVSVRVLVDRDRPDDPYRSTVINSRAAEYLRQRGVPVRFDRADQLLHSKVVVIDGNTVVVGSHNWSAGSYFHFDDLSLALTSKGLADEVTARIRRLWRGGYQ